MKIMRKTKPFQERFWSKVKLGDLDECWLWQGSLTRKGRYPGYGLLGHVYLNKAETSHRVSWLIHNGPIPNGKWVLHKCDKPSCVNPNHLFLGTPKDNTQDMLRKNRYPVGDRHYCRIFPEKVRRGNQLKGAKLNEEKVLKIILLRHIENISYEKLGELFGVSRYAVTSVCKGKSWSHVV